MDAGCRCVCAYGAARQSHHSGARAQTCQTEIPSRPPPELRARRVDHAAAQTLNNWFNSAAFSIPAKATWGNRGRLAARGPGGYEIDELLTKNFRLMAQPGSGGNGSVSSVHEDIPFPGYTAYCGSKGGMQRMMHNPAIELAPYRSNVNNSVLDDPAERNNAISEIPWGRFGKPERATSFAVFVAGDEAEDVTGNTYSVDGGRTQQVVL